VEYFFSAGDRRVHPFDHSNGLLSEVRQENPGAILVTFGATAALLFLHLHVETIGTRFGESPAACQNWLFRISHYEHLSATLVIGFHRGDAWAIESLMSAVVSDRVSNDKHNPTWN